MKRITLGALGLFLSISAFGTTCAPFEYTVGSSPAPSSCTVDNGSVTFSGFEAIGFANGQKIDVGVLDPGKTGQLSGLTISFNPAILTGPVSVGYTATITAGTFLSVDDSNTPAQFPLITYAGSGFFCGPNVSSCTKDLPAASTLLNTASLTGKNGPLQEFALDFVADSPVGLRETPEPATLALIGSGFLAMGLAYRKRKGRS